MGEYATYAPRYTPTCKKQCWSCHPEMVLFHACFVALKIRSPQTVTVNIDDYRLSSEKRLFQGKILDDEYHHSLAVFQDQKSNGLRILASVWSGELARVPIWTAFVSHQYDEPDWLLRKTDHRVWLKDLKIFVFCNEYSKRNQVRKHNYFELYFIDRKGKFMLRDVGCCWWCCSRR